MNVYCKNKLRSSGEGEWRTSAQVSEEAIAQILSGRFSCGGVDAFALGGGGSRHQADECLVPLKSTPVGTTRAASIDFI